MEYKKILSELKSQLGKYDFECYPFKVGWYNAHVNDKFKLNPELDHDTLCVLVINTPAMFEKLFLPYLFANFSHDTSSLDQLNDPIDECMSLVFETAKKQLEERFHGINISVVKDFELQPGTRRAKVVMQTCAHISGAAYFYDPKMCSLKGDAKKNLMGVCLHPRYGGWFAMRSVYIFSNVCVPDLDPVRIDDPLHNDESKIADLLYKFNYHWRDSTYRDVIKVDAKYSPLQQEYFNTEPRYRKALLKEWLAYPNQSFLSKIYEWNRVEEMRQKIYLEKNFYLE